MVWSIKRVYTTYLHQIAKHINKQVFSGQVLTMKSCLQKIRLACMVLSKTYYKYKIQTQQRHTAYSHVKENHIPVEKYQQ